MSSEGKARKHVDGIQVLWDQDFGRGLDKWKYRIYVYSQAFPAYFFICMHAYLLYTCIYMYI